MEGFLTFLLVAISIGLVIFFGAPIIDNNLPMIIEYWSVYPNN